LLVLPTPSHSWLIGRRRRAGGGSRPSTPSAAGSWRSGGCVASWGHCIARLTRPAWSGATGAPGGRTGQQGRSRWCSIQSPTCSPITSASNWRPGSGPRGAGRRRQRLGRRCCRCSTWMRSCWPRRHTELAVVCGHGPRGESWGLFRGVTEMVRHHASNTRTRYRVTPSRLLISAWLVPVRRHRRARSRSSSRSQLIAAQQISSGTSTQNRVQVMVVIVRNAVGSTRGQRPRPVGLVTLSRLQV